MMSLPFCPWCDRAFGDNALEPGIGGKVTAWEPATERVWNVCQRCARWSLWTDERVPPGEAIARLERTWLRHAGSPEAGLRDLLRRKRPLLRVGDWPLLDYLVLRYGRRRRRRVSKLGVTIAGVALGSWFLWSDAGLTLVTWAPAAMVIGMYAAISMWQATGRSLFTLRQPNGEMVRATASDARQLHVLIDADSAAVVPTGEEEIDVESAEGLRVLALSLSARNSGGFTLGEIESACRRLNAVESPMQILRATFSARGLGRGVHSIADLPRVDALTLEIAVNEASELGAGRSAEALVYSG